MFSMRRKLCCRFCLTDLWHEHTFIKCTSTVCVEQNVTVCLQCFAAGTGDDVHKNIDPYRVLSNAIEVEDGLWPAHEEIMLLDTFMDTMSWEKVARKLDRSPKECERHYFENFVYCPKIKGLERAKENAFRLDKLWTDDNNKYGEHKIIGEELDSEGIGTMIFKKTLYPVRM